MNIKVPGAHTSLSLSLYLMVDQIWMLLFLRKKLTIDFFPRVVYFSLSQQRLDTNPTGPSRMGPRTRIYAGLHHSSLYLHFMDLPFHRTGQGVWQTVAYRTIGSSSLFLELGHTHLCVCCLGLLSCYKSKVEYLHQRPLTTRQSHGPCLEVMC